jgi:hypothetical protein
MTRSAQVTHVLSAMKNERATRTRSEQASTADLAARRKIAIERDNLDAERWLDEGGSDSTNERHTSPHER